MNGATLYLHRTAQADQILAVKAAQSRLFEEVQQQMRRT